LFATISAAQASKNYRRAEICTEFWSECTSARVADETNESPKGFVSYLNGGFGHRFFWARGKLLREGLRVDVADLVALREPVEMT